MKRNFLLLLLLTLLPVAGWAQTITITLQKDLSWTYGDETPSITLSDVTVSASGGWGYNTRNSTFNASDDAKNAVLSARVTYIASVLAGNAGNYSNPLTDKSSGNYSYSGGNYSIAINNNSHKVTIAKATNTIESVTMADYEVGGPASTPSCTATSTDGTITYEYRKYGTTDAWSATAPLTFGWYDVRVSISESTNYLAQQASWEKVFKVAAKATLTTVPTLKGGLIYNGEAQDLIEGEAKFPVDYETTKGGVKYVATTTDVAPTTDAGATTEFPKMTNAKTYYVWYKALADDDLYIDGEWTKIGSSGVKISKRNITAADFTVTGVEGLKWTGSAQTLVNFAWTGEDRGTETFSDALAGTYVDPYQKTDVNETGYPVFIKIAGDENHNDFDATDLGLAVQIAKADNEFTAAPTATNADLTYDGYPKDLFAAGTATSGTAKYKVDWTSTDGQTTVEGTWVDAPIQGTNAGTYTLSYKAEENGNYVAVDVATLATTVTIKQAPVTVTGTATLNAGWTYDATAKNLVTANFPGVTGGTVKFIAKGENEDAATEFDFDTPAGQKKNADKYTVSYRLIADNSGNYKDVDAVEIDKVTVEQAGLDVAAQSVDVDWGTAVVATGLFKGDVTDLPAAETTPIEDIVGALVDFDSFKDSKGNDVDITGGLPTKADKYNFVLKLKDGAVGNYKINDFVKGGVLNINKVDPAIVGELKPVSVVYNTADQPLVDVNGATVDKGYGTFQYSLDGYKWEDDIPTGKDVAAYPVQCRIKGDDNHNDLALPTLNSEITPKDITAGDFTFMVGEEETDKVVYNGSAIDVKIKSDLKETEEYTVVVPAGLTDADTYTFKFTGTGNYQATVSKDFTINKAAATVTAPTAKAAENLVYTGQPLDLINPAIVENATVTYKLNDDEVELADVQGTNVADYKVEWTFTPNKNYEIVGVATDYIVVSITPKPVTPAAPEAIDGLVYDGTNQALVTEAENEGVTATAWSINGDDVAGFEYVKGFDAKTYAVGYKYTLSPNYKLADGAKEEGTVTASIDPRELKEEMFEFVKTEKPYTGEPIVFEFDVKDAEWTIMNEDATNYQCLKDDLIVDAGEYPFVFNGQNNYKGTFTVTCTVGQIKQKVTAPKKIDLTYDNTYQPLVEPATTDAVDGEVWYKVTYGNELITDWTKDFTKVVGKNAGEYVVESKATASETNYTNPNEENENVTVTIQKVTLGYTLSNLEKTWDGEAFTAAQTEKVFTLIAGELQGEDVYNVPFTLSLPDKDMNEQDITKGDAGIYTFKQGKVDPEEPTNYKVNFMGEAQVKINKADIVAADFTAPEGKTVGYNGSEQELVTSGAMIPDHEYGTIKFFAGATAPAEDSEDWTVAIPKETDKGTYKVWYMVAGDKNHNNLVAKTALEGTINANALMADFITMPEDGVYDGIGKLPEWTAADNFKNELTLDKDYTYEIKNNKNEKVESCQNAGLYTFTFKGIGNYEGGVFTKNWTIEQKTLTADMLAQAALETTYNAEDQKEEFNTLIPSDGEALNPEADLYIGLTYKSFQQGAGTDEIGYTAEMKNAGIYTATFTANPSGNYKNGKDELVATFTINRAELSATAPNITRTYDGSVGLEKVLGYDLQYTGVLGEDEIITPEDAYSVEDASKDAKGYFIAIDKEAFDFLNYDVTETTDGILTINKAAAIEVNFALGKEFTKTYGVADEDAGFEIGTLGFSEAVVEVDEELIAEQVELVRAEGSEGEAAGDGYFMTLAKTEDATVFDNYEGVTFGKAKLSIKQAELQISVESMAVIYNGEPQKAKLELNKLIVKGLVGDDTKESVFGPNAENLTATLDGEETQTNAGEYTLELAGDFGNYNVTTLPSNFTINPSPVDVTILTQKIVENGQLSNIDAELFEVEGLYGDQKATDIFQVVVAADYKDSEKITAAAGTYEDALVLEVIDDEMAANYVGWDDATGTLIVGLTQTTLDDKTDFVSYDEDNVNVVKFSERTINPDDWTVLCLPFDVTPAQVSDAFGYAAVDVLNEAGSTAGEVHFMIKTTGTIEAGTPFLVKPTGEEGVGKANFTDVEFYDVNIKAFSDNTEVPDAAGNKFIGTFKYTEFWGAEYWYMSKGAWKDASKFTESKPVTLKPFRAYVQFAEGAATRAIFIEEPDGTETAINAVEFNQMVNGEATYTLDGKKVNNVTQKGIYIKDGKKVAVK